MQRFDTYDILLEVLGYKYEKEEIPESIIERNMDEVLDLSETMGMKLKDNFYDLILLNDDVNDMMHVVLALFEIIGLNNEQCLKLMNQAHNSGEATVASGTKRRVFIMQKKLRERNLMAVIKRRPNTEHKKTE